MDSNKIVINLSHWTKPEAKTTTNNWLVQWVMDSWYTALLTYTEKLEAKPLSLLLELVAREYATKA